MWGTVVQWTSLLSSAVGSLLAKLERDKQALQNTDIRDALFQLLHLIRQWHRCASVTNYALAEWIKIGKLVDFELLDNRMHLQNDAIGMVLYSAGYPTEHYLWEQKSKRQKPKFKKDDVDNRGLLTALYIYEPKLEQYFRKVVDERLDGITRLRESMEDRADRASVNQAMKILTNDETASIASEVTERDVQDFDRTLMKIEGLANAIALFIADNYKLQGLTVKDVSQIKSVAKFFSLF